MGKKFKQKYQIGQIVQSKGKFIKILGVSLRTFKNQGKNTTQLYYYVMCQDCGQCYYRSAYSFGDTACPVCFGRIVVPGYNDIPTTAPWMIPYFQGGEQEAKKYTKNGGLKKIIPKCPVCGNIHDKSVYIGNLYRNHGFKCRCSDGISYPEKYMMSLLNQLHIPYVYQAQSNTLSFDTKKKIYDFYLPRQRSIIETNGEQHYIKSGYFKTLKEQQENDKTKYKIAKDNVENYIVIDCRKSESDWIRHNVMESKLPEILGFSEEQIDWQQCSRFATSNLAKEVCEYYNNHDVTMSDLIDHFSLGKHAIQNYLKIGMDNGWCLYLSTPTFFLCSPIEVYKDGVFYCYGKSKRDFARRSKELIGIAISSSEVVKRTDTDNDFHGFTFKTIPDFRKRREVIIYGNV